MRSDMSRNIDEGRQNYINPAVLGVEWWMVGSDRAALPFSLRQAKFTRIWLQERHVVENRICNGQNIWYNSGNRFLVVYIFNASRFPDLLVTCPFQVNSVYVRRCSQMARLQWEPDKAAKFGRTYPRSQSRNMYVDRRGLVNMYWDFHQKNLMWAVLNTAFPVYNVSGFRPFHFKIPSCQS